MPWGALGVPFGCFRDALGALGDVTGRLGEGGGCLGGVAGVAFRLLFGARIEYSVGNFAKPPTE